MFSFFLQPLAVAAEPTVVVESERPAVTPDITKVDSIEDGFGYFRLLWEKTVEWFRSEQENLLELAIGIAVTIIVAFLIRWLFRALLPKELSGQLEKVGKKPCRIRGTLYTRNDSTDEYPQQLTIHEIRPLQRKTAR